MMTQADESPHTPDAPGMTGAIGVIIVDHGSVRAESNESLERIVARFAATCQYQIIEPAHMELAKPDIADAFDHCVDQGAGHIIVIPFFLGPGKHWEQDIPALTTAAAQKHPGSSFRVADPIGMHPLIGDVLAARLEECLDEDSDEA
jgi:sirohydrochlorin ferrochelatase